EAYQAWEIIVEDGTSVVFPKIVDRLREDLLRVAGRLPKLSGADTQFLQAEVERALEELIQALQEAQAKKKAQQQQPSQSPPQQQQQQDKEEPLMPDSAELKLLRAAQLRVNRLTLAFDNGQAENPPNEPRRTEIQNIADLQFDISELTQEMIERARQQSNKD
ncbi:MAG: hypothetical protein N2C14_21215, partial [Planctomycetales bacterium]